MVLDIFKIFIKKSIGSKTIGQIKTKRGYPLPDNLFWIVKYSYYIVML